VPEVLRDEPRVACRLAQPRRATAQTVSASTVAAGVLPPGDASVSWRSARIPATNCGASCSLTLTTWCTVDPLATVESATLTQGVAFLYAQATELLSSWRGRRRAADAPPPRALAPPLGVAVGGATPLADPPSDEAIDTLQDLISLVAPIQAGVIDPGSAAAHQVVTNLRGLLEAALRAPISFAGEAPRPVQITDIALALERISGRVVALRADLSKLPHGAEIRSIRITSGDLAPGADVTGVDLV